MFLVLLSLTSEAAQFEPSIFTRPGSKQDILSFYGDRISSEERNHCEQESSLFTKSCLIYAGLSALDTQTTQVVISRCAHNYNLGFFSVCLRKSLLVEGAFPNPQDVYRSCLTNFSDHLSCILDAYIKTPKTEQRFYLSPRSRIGIDRVFGTHFLVHETTATGESFIRRACKSDLINLPGTQTSIALNNQISGKHINVCFPDDYYQSIVERLELRQTESAIIAYDGYEVGGDYLTPDQNNEKIVVLGNRGSVITDIIFEHWNNNDFVEPHIIH
ncbi:MAG: hypothetical protein ACRBBP_06775 [Bdellovibrionales bacterium]